MCHYEHIYSPRPGQNRSSSVQSVRDPQSAPERSCELAELPDDHTLPVSPTVIISPIARSRSTRKEHLLFSTCRPHLAPSPAALAGRPHSHGHTSQPANGCWREPGGLASGHGRRTPGGGGRCGCRAAERGAHPRASGQLARWVCERGTRSNASYAPRGRREPRDSRG